MDDVRRAIHSWAVSTGFRSNFATLRAALPPGEPTPALDARLAFLAGYDETGQRTIFQGEAEDTGRDLWPVEGSVAGRGLLARTERAIGVGDPTADPDDDGTYPAWQGEGLTDGAVVSQLLALYGIPAGNVQSDQPERTFGNLRPLRLGVNQPAWQLIAELDRLTFMRTFDHPDGTVWRLPVDGRPASPALTLTEGVHLIAGTSGSRTRRTVVNKVAMTGLADAGGPGLTPRAELEVPGAAYVPDPPGFVVEEWQSDLAETEEECARYASRRVGQLANPGETAQVALDRGRPDIYPGMSIAIASPQLGYGSGDLFWVEQVDHRGDGRAWSTTLGLLAASVAGGVNRNQPPVPVIRISIMAQTLGDGTGLWVVFADGRDSYDPDGVAIDEDPRHGIGTYLWSGDPVGPSTPAGLPTATFVYTSDPTGATICLTVSDVSLKLATACVTITRRMVDFAVRAHIWAAVEADLLFTPDGGRTWAELGIPATVLAREAHDDYQLAATGDGDVWRIAVDEAGGYAADQPASAPANATALNINKGPDGRGTGRCWIGCADGATWLSTDDGLTWAQQGSIAPPAGSSGPTIRVIEESPYAFGQVKALCGNAEFVSYDNGATWAVLKAYADPALDAVAMASGRFADVSQDKGFTWIAWRGTSANTSSRIHDETDFEAVDWPAAAKPAQPTGLVLGVFTPWLVLVDVGGAGTGRAWLLEDFTGGGELAERSYEPLYGPPRDIARHGRFEEIIGAADEALFKTLDKFGTMLTLKLLEDPQVGRMIAFGRLQAQIKPTQLIMSAYKKVTNTDKVGHTTNKIVRLTRTGWQAVADHPIGTAAHATIANFPGYTNFGASPASTAPGTAQLSFCRPLLRAPDGRLWTYCFARYADLMHGCNEAYDNLWYSEDEGETWTFLVTVSGVTSLAIDGNNVLWAVAQNGEVLLRSATNGASWEVVESANPAQALGLTPPPAVWPWLNKWCAIAAPRQPGGGLVACATWNGGAVTTEDAFATKVFAAASDYSLRQGQWGLCPTPGGDGFLFDRADYPSPGGVYARRVARTATATSVPDGMGDGDAGVRTAVAPDYPAALVESHGLVIATGRAQSGDDGATAISSDNGASFAAVYTQADIPRTPPPTTQYFAWAAGAAVDPATGQIALSILYPFNNTGTSTGPALVRRAGDGGAWQDLTGDMESALGGIYVAHPLGLLAEEG